MSVWVPWSAEAFARAKAQGKPVLAAAGAAPPDDLGSLESDIAGRFVAVLADPETRPDVAARLGDGAVILDSEGARRGTLTSAVAEELERLAGEASSPLKRPETSPAWTGAVREDSVPSSPGGPELDEVFAELASGEAEPDPASIEALLHAAYERGEEKARAALSAALERAWAGRDASALAFAPGTGSALTLNARWASAFWDVHAATGEGRWREAASAASDHLLRVLWDPSAGAFRRGGRSQTPVFPADGNALAASALIRAHAFGHPGAGEAAMKALGFIQSRLYDPLLGLQHSAGGEGESVVGLLGDAAATALAFTDGYQSTGLKAHREFADLMLRFLFQELWERDGGGFLDRVPRAGDPAILLEPNLDPALNALALEVCRRLHHLKGNHNYRRWLEWGLTGAWSAAARGAGSRAGLARVADMHARGRMDFELVGRPGESRADALLAAVHRLYLPRKVISFVDPDDQDYILAHRLEADSYPRLFGCGSDLRRLADAAEPAGVPAVAEALNRAGGEPT